MGDTALISRPKTCDVHKDHEARYDAAIVQGNPPRRVWANVCEDAFKTFAGSLGTGRGQRLVVVDQDYRYRGYTIGLMPTGDAVILANGDYIDTAASLKGAEARIDEWMEAR